MSEVEELKFLRNKPCMSVADWSTVCLSRSLIVKILSAGFSALVLSGNSVELPFFGARTVPSGNSVESSFFGACTVPSMGGVPILVWF